MNGRDRGAHRWEMSLGTGKLYVSLPPVMRAGRPRARRGVDYAAMTSLGSSGSARGSVSAALVAAIR